MLYSNTHLANVKSIYDIDCARGTVTRELGTVIDFFGDGTVWAVCTPGHSRSHLSYLVLTTEGPVLFTGDASHTKTGFVKGVEPGWADDRKLAQRSFARLRAFAARYPDVRVVYGHEL